MLRCVRNFMPRMFNEHIKQGKGFKFLKVYFCFFMIPEMIQASPPPPPTPNFPILELTLLSF